MFLSRQARGYIHQDQAKAPSSGTLPACSTALIRCRVLALSAFSPVPFSRLGARGKRAGKRRRGRLSCRRGARPPRRGRPAKPALGRRFPPTPGLKRRRSERGAGRPDRGCDGFARCLPPRPAGRRCQAGEQAIARLAGFVRRARQGSGVRLSAPPSRFSRSRVTRPCRMRSTPPRRAREAIARHRSPRHMFLPLLDAP